MSFAEVGGRQRVTPARAMLRRRATALRDKPRLELLDAILDEVGSPQAVVIDEA